MKLVKALGIIVIILAVLAGGVWQFWGKGLAADAQIGSAFAAKHVCSCLHVAEQDMDFCLSDFVQDVGPLTITNDGNTTTAKAPLGLGSAKARYEPGVGCALVQAES